MLPCRLMKISVSWSGAAGAGQDPSDREGGRTDGRGRGRRRRGRVQVSDAV